jgi:hypothetical protein
MHHYRDDPVAEASALGFAFGCCFGMLLAGPGAWLLSWWLG